MCKKILLFVFVAILFICLFSCKAREDNSADGSDGHSDDTQPVITYDYSIAYELDGGFSTNPKGYNAGDEITLRNPIKNGFIFTGWTYDGQTEPIIGVKIDGNATGNKTFVAHYKEYEFEPLKVAVFADVQLTSDRNQAATANAYLALKDHFRYAKSIGADVLFMSGDIINNAVESYYQLYEKALKEIYGEDESRYPEFVMNMGNHEWWDVKEGENANAVTLFKKYARIDSPYLMRESAVPYYLNADETLPSYYKVIKGVPFLAVSADRSSGFIGDELKAELSSWLKEIAELESVKNGGPIFVSYHYPIPAVTFNGEHAEAACIGIDELLKNYPSAVVFTGDTHFNGVNERTINQVDYTSINIGTSSYSRAVSRSATGFRYDNVNRGYGKSSAGTMKGEVAFKYEYTPTMMVAEINSPDKMTIDRYFTADNVDDVKKIGKTWEIKNVKSKNDFIYTNKRFEDASWANWLYGKDAPEWGDGERVAFNVTGNKMIVRFNDVIDYNCVEHYRIEVVGDSDYENAKYYDFMSPYYKYEDAAHVYNYVLEDIPTAASYSVTVTAYDFFDNASSNVLTSDIVDESVLFPEDMDVRIPAIYSDISKRINYEVHCEGSNSSVEYYYKGTKKFPGMIMTTLFATGKTENVGDYLSVEDWAEAKLRFKIKNENDYDLYFAFALVVEENGKEKWLTDGVNDYRKTVYANADWTIVEWDLSEMFELSSNSIRQLSLKVVVPESVVDEENGYELSFYLDDIDVIE